MAKTKNRMTERNLRPLTVMQLETLLAFFYGEVTIAAARPAGLRRYMQLYHGSVNITGRYRSLWRRGLIKTNYDATYGGRELSGFIVTDKGIAELRKHGEPN